ncbi:hypothetical protein Ae201684P_019181 [Aphanomyces euteiches]|uniref:Uncharacterized protein n=1 Tax=Aphanomyces euteiches TaxID=100861 RepID=A0A6G0XEK8_9STRA|nr:hypothetical protein Ae201684_005616 [Aphanomyces euteiches]KAH9078078.1 hypothetical protein Ae201684P_019181 [Aphanomyces euteiches]
MSCSTAEATRGTTPAMMLAEDLTAAMSPLGMWRYSTMDDERGAPRHLISTELWCGLVTRALSAKILSVRHAAMLRLRNATKRIAVDVADMLFWCCPCMKTSSAHLQRQFYTTWGRPTWLLLEKCWGRKTKANGTCQRSDTTFMTLRLHEICHQEQ